jgi:hypothetical protein
MTKAKAKPRTIRERRDRVAYRREKAELKLLESIFWDDFGGSEMLFDRLRDRDGTQWSRIVPSLPSDRRHGANWPFWRTELELDRLRQLSRMLVRANSYGEGLLKNLTNHTIGKGFTYKAAASAAAKKLDADPSKAGKQLPPQVEAAVAAVQAVVDDFLKLNRWNCAADPLRDEAIGETRERELYRRTKRDGEAFVRFFFLENGVTKVRFVEPELVRQPPGKTEREGWSFGTRNRVEPYEDFEDVEEYHLCYSDAGLGNAEQKENPQGEFVDALEVVHVKNVGEDAATKRGTPAFVWDTADALNRASKLQRYVSMSAAIRAATAEIWQHQTGTQSQLTSLAQGNAERTRTDPVTGKSEVIERVFPGMVRRVPQGQQLMPPPASTGVTEHMAAAQGDLRQASTAFCAPEYMTGDASNANYASTQEAGTPFVRSAEAEQEHYKAAFLACVWKAVRWAAECGRLPAEVLAWVEVQVEAPLVTQRNELELAQVDQILIPLGVKDPQTASMERGLDPETVGANLAEHEERFGGQAPDLQLPGADGKVPPVRESRLRESRDDAGHEHDDKGLFTDTGGGGAKDGGKKTTAGAADDGGKSYFERSSAFSLKADAAFDALHRQLDKGKVSQAEATTKANALQSRASEQVDRLVRHGVAELKARLLAKHGDGDELRDHLHSALDAIKDRREDVWDALDARAQNVIQNHGKKDRRYGSADLLSAMGRLDNEILGAHDTINRAMTKRVRESRGRARRSRPVRESKDANGQEHDDQGRFAGPGGTGGRQSKTKRRAARREQQARQLADAVGAAKAQASHPAVKAAVAALGEAAVAATVASSRADAKTALDPKAAEKAARGRAKEQLRASAAELTPWLEERFGKKAGRRVAGNLARLADQAATELAGKVGTRLADARDEAGGRRGRRGMVEWLQGGVAELSAPGVLHDCLGNPEWDTSDIGDTLAGANWPRPLDGEDLSGEDQDRIATEEIDPAAKEVYERFIAALGGKEHKTNG